VLEKKHTALMCSGCICARVFVRASLCLFQEARESAIWIKIQIVSQKPGRGRICILCSRLTPWHRSRKGKEPETGCGGRTEGS